MTIVLYAMSTKIIQVLMMDDNIIQFGLSIDLCLGVHWDYMYGLAYDVTRGMVSTSCGLMLCQMYTHLMVVLHVGVGGDEKMYNVELCSASRLVSH